MHEQPDTADGTRTPLMHDRVVEKSGAPCPNFDSLLMHEQSDGVGGVGEGGGREARLPGIVGGTN